MEFVSERGCGNVIVEPVGVSGGVVDVAEWAGSVSVDELAVALRGAAAAVSAVQARLGVALAVFAQREGFAGGGIGSLGHWGSINLGFSARQTSSLAASGSAALRMGELRSAWESGELSTEKARIVAGSATEQSVGRWVDIALEASGSQLARIAGAYRRSGHAAGSGGDVEGRDVDPAEEVGLWWLRRGDGLMELSAVLEPDDAGVVKAALAKTLEVEWRSRRSPADASRSDAPSCPDAPSGSDAHTGSDAPCGPARRAAALCEMAESVLASGPVPMVGAERTVVHLGVDAAFLTGRSPEGHCEITGIGSVDLSTAAAMACDARIRGFLRHPDGTVSDLGREQRLVSARQRRLLQLRDQGCVFPGCTSRLFVDAHHAVPWAAGGRTDLDNLLLLCRRHHRGQHRGEFQIQVLGHQKFRFVDRYGRPIHPPPKPATPGQLQPVATDTRARSGGDPNYSLDLTVSALCGSIDQRSRSWIDADPSSDR